MKYTLTVSAVNFSKSDYYTTANNKEKAVSNFAYKIKKIGNDSRSVKDIKDEIESKVNIVKENIKEIVKSLVNEVLNEGTWAFDPSHGKQFIKDIENLKKKYYHKIGDDKVFDGLDDAINRINEMLKEKIK